VDYLTRIIGYMKTGKQLLGRTAGGSAESAITAKLEKEKEKRGRVMLKYVDYDIVFQEIPTR